MDSIINDPGFQKSLHRIAKDLKSDPETVQKEAVQYINELRAQQHPLAKMASVRGFHYILSRAYNEQIDVDPNGIKKLMRLMKICLLYTSPSPRDS